MGCSFCAFHDQSVCFMIILRVWVFFASFLNKERKIFIRREKFLCFLLVLRLCYMLVCGYLLSLALLTIHALENHADASLEYPYPCHQRLHDSCNSLLLIDFVYTGAESR